MKLRNGLIGLLVAVVTATGAACGADQATLPLEQETPMPSFEYSWSGCTAWSCASGQCPREPAIWGACCIEQDPNNTEVSRPSCENPEGPYVYCDAHPERCESGSYFNLVPEECYATHIGNDPITPWLHPECYAGEA